MTPTDDKVRRVRRSRKRHHVGVAAGGIAALSAGSWFSMPGGSGPHLHPAASTQIGTAKVDPPLAPPLDAPVAAYFANQAAVDDVASQLEKSGTLLPGYGGLIVSPSDKSLSLYWKGVLPTDLQQSVRDAAVQQGVKVRVVAATFSHAELESARAKLRGRGDVTSIAIAPDATGLEVGTDVPDSALPDKGAELTGAAGKPVKVHREATVKLARWADTRPFYGGAVYSNSSGPLCSMGFGVHDAKGSSPHYYIFTADHCRETVNYTTPAGLGVGPPYEWQSDFDTMIINTGSGVASGNRIYSGGVDQSGGGANESTRVVKQFDPAQNGDIAAQSGGFSGETGNLKVVNNDVQIGSFQHEVELEQQRHTDGAGEGDSGGPVYKKNSDGSVRGFGVVSVGDTTTRTSCQGVGGARQCFWRIYAGNMSYQKNTDQVVLNVG